MKIYEDILSKIANMVAINYQRLEHAGIMEGDMGVAMFLFHYSEYSGIKSYADLAESIVDYNINYYIQQMGRTFSCGIFGIGWSLCYLKANGFIDMADNVLSDIDRIALLKYTKLDISDDLDVKYPLFSKGLYCIYRNNALKAKTITDLASVASYLKECDITLDYVISIIYFLKECIKAKVQENMCDELVKSFGELLQSIIRNGTHNEDLFVRYILEINLEDGRYENECDPLLYYSNWRSIIYKNIASGRVHISDINKYIEKIERYLPTTLISLNGLSSLGINLIKLDYNKN